MCRACHLPCQFSNKLNFLFQSRPQSTILCINVTTYIMILTRRASFIQAAVIFIYFYSFVAANFAISAPDIPIDNFVYQGNASIEASGITLTWGQRFTSSIVYWNTSQTISYGFRSSVLYQNFDCDTYSIYLGGDG